MPTQRDQPGARTVTYPLVSDRDDVAGAEKTASAASPTDQPAQLAPHPAPQADTWPQDTDDTPQAAPQCRALPRGRLLEAARAEPARP